VRLTNEMKRYGFSRLVLRKILQQKIDKQMWNKLVQVNADVILPLNFGGVLKGPARDRSVMQNIIYNYGLYEPEVTNFLIHTLKPGDTFIDIGANLGYFTVLASSLVGQNGRVISFEPLRTTFEYCKSNIELNQLKNADLYKYALWDKNQIKEFNFSDFDGGDSHAVSTENVYNNTSIKEKVECIKMDQLNLRPNTIKMDIEGSEPFALSGMYKTLEEFRPTIVLEVNRFCLKNYFGLDSEDIWNILSGLNYKISLLSEKNQELIKTLKHLNELCPPNQLINVVAEP
jgi:FkbM family methyltransferase